MNSFQRIFILIFIICLIIGCTDNKMIQDSRIIIKEDKSSYENWFIKTKELISSSEIEEDEFVDYSSLLNRETSLNETWRAISILDIISTEYEKSSVWSYVKSYTPEDTMEQLMLNSIANILGGEDQYNIDYSRDLATILEDEMDDLEKLDIIFLYHLYGNENKITRLDSNLIREIKTFLANIKIPNESHYGYFYNLSYLCEKYNIKSKELDTEHWRQKLDTGFEDIDAVNSYFILKINLILNNEVTAEKLQGFLDIEGINDAIKNNSIHAIYLVTEIANQTERMNYLDKTRIESSILSQQSENGGFYIRKILKPDLTATILSQSILIDIEGGDKKNSQDFFFNVFSSDLGWKVKYFGFNLFTEEIQSNNINEIQNELKIYYDLFLNVENQVLYNNLTVYEDILYAMQLSEEVNIDIPEEIRRIMLSASRTVLTNFKDFSPIEISFALDTFKLLDIKIPNEQEISGFFSSFYDERLNRFVYKERDEMMINYYIIKSLLNIKNDYKVSELRSIIMEFAEIDKGGFNTFKNEFKTSSLITTFYGITLLNSF